MGAVHHHLINERLRMKVGLIVETGEAREVHHMCVLLGYGVDAICPYLAFNIAFRLNAEGLIRPEMTEKNIILNYVKALNVGISKVIFF